MNFRVTRRTVSRATWMQRRLKRWKIRIGKGMQTYYIIAFTFRGQSDLNVIRKAGGWHDRSVRVTCTFCIFHALSIFALSVSYDLIFISYQVQKYVTFSSNANKGYNNAKELASRIPERPHTIKLQAEIGNRKKDKIIDKEMHKVKWLNVIGMRRQLGKRENNKWVMVMEQ